MNAQRDRAADRHVEVADDPHRVVHEDVHRVRRVDQPAEAAEDEEQHPQRRAAEDRMPHGSQRIVCEKPRTPARRAASSNEANIANAVMNEGITTP